MALDPWAQVVERELFARMGWAWLDHQIREVRTEVADGGRAARVHLAWTGPDGTAGSGDAEVEVTRILPVLVCGEPPEAAKKVSPEYALVRLDTSS
jgi:hypothetical protein